MDDQQVHDLLTEAGRRWRATLPPARDAEAAASRFRGRHAEPTSLWTGLVLAAAAVLAVMFALRSPLATHPSAASVSPLGTALDWSLADYEAAILHPGERATAIGSVVQYPGEPLVICLTGPLAGVDYGQPHPPFACSSFRVPLEGLDPASLPDRADASGAVYSRSGLTVAGLWTGTAVRVSSVERTPTAPQVAETISCRPPGAGWPTPPADLEAAVGALADEVAAHPDLYSTYWLPESGGSGSALAVALVGTVGDPEAVRTDLESAYPYGLCGVKVRYSAAQLQVAYDAVSKAADANLGQELDVQLDARRDRIRARMTMITPELRDLLQPYPQVVPEPLLRGTS